MQPENEHEVRKVYRDYMAAELARPEIQNQKEKLTAFFEAPAMVPTFSLVSGAGMMLPLLFLGFFFFSLQHIQNRIPEIAGPSMPLYLQEVPLEDPVKNHMKPRVVVKRVTSRVGPTMVYQKVYRETPVTIVWVFNRLPAGQAGGGKLL